MITDDGKTRLPRYIEKLIAHCYSEEHVGDIHVKVVSNDVTFEPNILLNNTILIGNMMHDERQFETREEYLEYAKKRYREDAFKLIEKFTEHMEPSMTPNQPKNANKESTTGLYIDGTNVKLTIRDNKPFLLLNNAIHLNPEDNSYEFLKKVAEYTDTKITNEPIIKTYLAYRATTK